MNVWDFPFAILAFLTIVLAAPLWTYFLVTYSPGLTTEDAFLAGLVPVFLTLLFVAGWIDA